LYTMAPGACATGNGIIRTGPPTAVAVCEHCQPNCYQVARTPLAPHRLHLTCRHRRPPLVCALSSRLMHDASGVVSTSWCLGWWGARPNFWLLNDSHCVNRSVVPSPLKFQSAKLVRRPAFAHQKRTRETAAALLTKPSRHTPPCLTPAATQVRYHTRPQNNKST